ncbi:MAG: hypothetical protein AB7O76_09940 [Rhizobiaceae bacterium]
MGQVLGTDKIRRAVFNAVYGRHTRPADIHRIMEIANLGPKTKQQVRNALNVLSQNKLIVCLAADSRSGFPHKRYEKAPWVNARKKIVLKAADQKAWRENLPTKTRPRGTHSSQGLQTKIVYEGAKISVVELTIDDIDSFAKVRKVPGNSKTLASLSEDEFKKGIQRIVNEEGTFKDWGGEQADLVTTRVTYNGKRVAAAFAFKGPGMKRKLTPGTMGANGDQAQRLFGVAVELYVVQHWREIDPSVRVLLNSLAVAQSVMRNKTIRYCLIDGQDSQRIVLAYPEAFKPSAT